MAAVEATEFEFIVIAMVLSSLISLLLICGRHHAAPFPGELRESFPDTFPRKVN